MKTRRGVRQGCCWLPLLFNLQNEYLIKEALEEFGYFRTGGQVIRSVKYADDLVLQAEDKTVIHSMTNRLNEIGICYGMEMNVEKKSEVIRISRQPSPSQIMTHQKLHNVKYFNYLCSVTDNKRCKMYTYN
jgi:hypothetical protein